MTSLPVAIADATAAFDRFNAAWEASARRDPDPREVQEAIESQGYWFI
jgi:hypothetical protein